MVKKLNSILLIDDNPDDNFIHERVIRKNNLADAVITKNGAEEALDYIRAAKNDQTPSPDLIFLDINMPGMNGWEFLEEYNKLDHDLQGKVIIVMLTTSENPDDKRRAKTWNFVSDFKTKPLTKDMMDEILEKYFK